MASAVSSEGLRNKFKMLGFVGPYVMIGFFVLSSIFNSNLKGWIYLAGVIILLSLTSSLDAIANLGNSGSHNVCRIFGNMLSNTGLSFGILIYCFTFAYLLFPMYQFRQINFQIMIILILLCFMDGTLRRENGCSTAGNIIASVVFGGFFGLVWSLLVYTMNSEMLYHTEYISDKVACSIPSKQKFKCVTSEQI